MSELVSDFEIYLCQERMRSPATVKRYIAVVTKFAAFLAETRGPEAISFETVEKADLVGFLKRLSPDADGPSRVVWNIRLASLRSFYDWLFKMELVKVNLAMRIDRLKTSPREPVPLSLDEFLDLVEAAKQGSHLLAARNVAILQVLFHCALRVSEVVSIDVEQIDFDNYLISNVRTKGSKWLTIPFNDLVAEALERYLSRRANTDSSSTNSPLFLSTRRGRLSVRAAEEMVRNCAVEAGIRRPVGPHLVRHSGATELADMGTPIRVLPHPSVSLNHGFEYNKTEHPAGVLILRNWRLVASGKGE